MEFPEFVRVGASYYEVSKERMHDDMGNCSNTHFSIRISDDLGEENTVSTFVHEILHAMASEYNANVSTKHEEAMVRAIENGIRGFAKDHNVLFHALLDELAKEPGGNND